MKLNFAKFLKRYVLEWMKRNCIPKKFVSEIMWKIRGGRVPWDNVKSDAESELAEELELLRLLNTFIDDEKNELNN